MKLLNKKRDNKSSIAIIIPVFEPPTGWGKNSLEHIIALKALFPEHRFRFIIVNDGSEKRHFRDIIKALTKLNINYNFHKLSKNQGKGKALKIGVSKNKADYYICVDWDFPFGITIIGEIIDKLKKGKHVVIVDRGSQYLKNLPLFRAQVTGFWRIFINRFLKLNVGDTQGGIKGFRDSVATVFTGCKIDSFLHDLEFVYTCRRKKIPIAIINAELKPGVKFSNFSLTTYFRELLSLMMFFKITKK